MPVRFNTSGGGIDPDELTARPEHVLKNKKFAGQGSDEQQIGTMNNFAGMSYWACGYEHTSVQVHPDDKNQALVTGIARNGSGFIENNTTKIEMNIANAVPKNIKYGVKIGRTEYGNNGADSTNTITGEFTGDANISSKDIRRGKIAYSKGQRIIGDMNEIGMIYYLPTTKDQIIKPDQYIESNLTVGGDPNLIAANIKKGVTIFGVTGTWEGYVPTVNDLYLRGNQLVPWKGSSASRFDEAQIWIGSEGWIQTSNLLNLVGKTKLNIQYNAKGINSSSYTEATTSIYGESDGPYLGRHTDTEGENIVSFDLANAQGNKKIRIYARNIGNRYIKRIWLS